MATVSGGEELTRHLEELARKLGSASKVRAGFTERARYPDGTPVAVAAAANNFGAPRKGIPPRPFFSNAIANNKPAWGQRLGLELRAAGLDSREALERMGAVMAGDIAVSLVQTNAPALSPVTLLLRERFPDRTGMTFADVTAARRDIANGTKPGVSGSGAKPLVWTGFMLQSLQGPQAYEVE